MKFLFVTMNNMGNELTGGDTIWIELFHKWSRNNEINFLWTVEAQNLLWFERGCKVEPTLFNIAKNMVLKLYHGIKGIPKEEYDYVYSVSDFYPDLIPALIYKLKHPKCRWIAGYYLVAPPPFAQNSPYKGLNWLKGLLYWLMQRLSLFLVNKWADIVFVTSEPDRKWFPRKKVVVVRGGVETKWTYDTFNVKKKYDAIFIGRFHYQKGVFKLIDIWRRVCEEFPNAKLCMIGNGPLDLVVNKKIERYGLEKNVICLGFKNGIEKINLIKQSRMVLHPATYDSGGMACAEAMVWGLPAIGFDLPAFKTYYEKGMVKVKTEEEFSEQIIRFMNKEGIKEWGEKARKYVLEKWDWDKRAQEIYNEIV